jgi:hypothetical protein
VRQGHRRRRVGGVCGDGTVPASGSAVPVATTAGTPYLPPGPGRTRDVVDSATAEPGPRRSAATCPASHPERRHRPCPRARAADVVRRARPQGPTSSVPGHPAPSGRCTGRWLRPLHRCLVTRGPARRTSGDRACAPRFRGSPSTWRARAGGDTGGRRRPASPRAGARLSRGEAHSGLPVCDAPQPRETGREVEAPTGGS